MHHYVKNRFFSSFSYFQSLKIVPFSIQQMGLSSIADTIYTHLNKTNGTTIENALSKTKPKLDSQCVIQVLNKCYPKQSQLGVRFFIWAGFQSGYRHSGYMYRKVCNLFEIDKNPEIICDVIKAYEVDGCVVNVNMFREVLKLCKEAENVDLGLWVLRKMEDFEMKPDTVMYNVVIKLVCKKGDVEMGERLMKEMSLNGICPDLITYMTMIEGLCNAGRLEEAYEMVKVMRGNGCSPNLVILSAVLDGFCRLGSMERALELLDEMEKSGDCCPNVVTYTSLIQSFCKRGEWTEALNILDRMRAFGCFANHVTVFTLIESLCTKGRVDEAYKVVDKLVVEHCVSRGDCYNSLVISFIRIKKLEEAENLFKEMLAAEIKPDTLASSLLLKELCLKDRVLDGFYLLDTIENMGFLSSIDSDIYSILLIGLCQKNHLTEATKLAKIMLKKAVPLRPPYKDRAIDFLRKYGEKDLVKQLTGIHKEL